MSKRFIDTGLFDDPWFMSLSKDGKLLWIYLISKCDHAGIIEINEKLLKFQTGINSYQTVTKELGNRLLSVRDKYYFIPKFIEFQYPKFPNSKVKQQQSAVEILKKFGLFANGVLTVGEDLYKDYDSGSDTDSDIDDEKKDDYENIKTQYLKICNKLPKVVSLNDQRKKHIKSRIEEYSEEQLIEVFKKANNSDFLTGKNEKGWTASFDWLILPSNFIKVLEGNYDNKQGQIHFDDKNPHLSSRHINADEHYEGGFRTSYKDRDKDD